MEFPRYSHDYSKKTQSLQKKHKKTKGTCEVCSKTFTLEEMSAHLIECCKNDAESFWLLFVQSDQFWMFLKIKAGTKLVKIDKLLRREWLECCYHLSEFEIQGIHFVSDANNPMDDTGKKMTQSIDPLFKEDLYFHHVYDFGSSTDSYLQVVGFHDSTASKKQKTGEETEDSNITILARNVKPQFRCSNGSCKKKATHLYTGHEEPLSYLCADCAESFDDDAKYLLSDCANSPRVGICGYLGN